MPFGYKLPNFNAWGRYYRRLQDVEGGTLWAVPRYFPCQLQRTEARFSNQLAVPKHLGFRPIDQTPGGLGDVVQIAGNEYMWWVVVSVCDVGSGFANEHRVISLTTPNDQSWDSARGLFIPATNTTLLPPPGYEEMFATLPADFWQDPTILSEEG